MPAASAASPGPTAAVAPSPPCPRCSASKIPRSAASSRRRRRPPRAMRWPQRRRPRHATDRWRLVRPEATSPTRACAGAPCEWWSSSYRPSCSPSPCSSSSQCSYSKRTRSCSRAWERSRRWSRSGPSITRRSRTFSRPNSACFDYDGSGRFSRQPQRPRCSSRSQCRRHRRLLANLYLSGLFVIDASCSRRDSISVDVLGIRSGYLNCIVYTVFTWTGKSIICE